MMDSKHKVTWRLLVNDDDTGPRNMGIDEALLVCYPAGGSIPVLRLYGWSPPALSLGRFQDTGEAIDLDRCREDRVCIVRRVSGGGTIYHADELTYSIVCTQDQIPAATSVKDSFRVLTGFLLEFYRSLGLDARYAADVAPCDAGLGERTAFCFAGRESFDILIDGRKIGGNAQRRMRNLIFQHGSIPLVNRAAVGLQYMMDRNPGNATGCTSLAEYGITRNRSALLDLLSAAFERHMGAVVVPDRLSRIEQVRAEELFATKYNSDHWNLKGTVA